MKTFLAIVTASTLMGFSLLAAEPTAPVVPRPAPELTFTLPGKGPVELSQYRGKVVCLAFMFTTCPHCQAKSKELTKLQEDLGPRGLQVIGIAVNPNADLLTENFVKDFKIGFPVGYMPSERLISFMGFNSTDRWVVPQLALLDRKGTIRYQTTATETDAWDKLMATEALRGHIEELLNMGGGGKTASTAQHKSLPGLDTPVKY
jgi:peroxiredoxin